LRRITLPMGITSSKEYAELEWPIDLLITVVWVAYAVLFFGTIVIRKTKQIYVANWFFGAYIVTIALLHMVNNIELPWILGGRVPGGSPTPPTPASMTPWCSGGTATMRSVSS
jgi:cbb3-type cytochrome oxidase subunit 1